MISISHTKQEHLKPGDALIVVDLQNDFLPGGALAVPTGNEIIAVLNDYLKIFKNQGMPVFATRDWHPANHCSFKEYGGIWPVHCVQGTEGAKFAERLHLPGSAETISKATQQDKDSYSGFQETGLDDRLKSMDIQRLFVGGLATDYCVFHTVKDALQCGYHVFLLKDAVRAVNLNPGDGEKAIEEMVRLGSQVMTFEQLS